MNPGVEYSSSARRQSKKREGKAATDGRPAVKRHMKADSTGRERDGRRRTKANKLRGRQKKEGKGHASDRDAGERKLLRWSGARNAAATAVAAVVVER